MELYIKAPLFGVSICCLIGNKESLLNFAYRNLSREETADLTVSTETAEGLCFYSSKGLLMWFENIENAEVVYHEALHAACEVMKFCGSPVSFENQETLAYLQGCIVSEINQAHKKELKKQKRKEVI